MSANRDFQRLHRRKDIVRVFRQGRRVRGQAFDLIFLSEGDPRLRIAVVVPLHGQRAVDRNRVKRRTKEAIRTAAFLGAQRVTSWCGRTGPHTTGTSRVWRASWSGSSPDGGGGPERKA